MFTMISTCISNKIIRFSVSIIAGLALVISVVRSKRKLKTTNKHLVFITGCDSGLGYTVALRCYELGMFVVAGCLNVQSDGAKKLRDLCGNTRMVVIEIDIRSNDSIIAAEKCITELIEKNELIFATLINNAGIMAFGEFEWQTLNMIENQIQVNILGTMKLTKQFLPLCRKYKSRIIIVTSHCSIQALPGLAAYAATKAALSFFTDSLRVEMQKYHVNVVNFIPGSFVTQSNIFARQRQYALEMRNELSEDQRNFYGEYFNEYNNYLQSLSQYREPCVISDGAMLRLWDKAILDVNPKAVYKNQNWRYAVYHFLCDISPVFIRDWLVLKFMQMPQYNPMHREKIVSNENN